MPATTRQAIPLRVSNGVDGNLRMRRSRGDDPRHKKELAMRHVSSVVVIASLFVAAHGAAYGAPLQSYTPQTSGGTLITFEGQAEGTLISNQFSGVTFSQPDVGRPMIDTYENAGWLFGYGASSGSAVLTGSTEGGAAFPTIAGIIATFSSPVSSVEVFLSDTSPFDTGLGGPYTISAYGAGETLLESFVVARGTVVPPGYAGGVFPPPGTTPLPGIFVGFVRPSGDIVSIQIGPSSTANDAFAIDDLRFNKVVAIDDAYAMNEDMIIDTAAQERPGVLANDTPGTTALLVAAPEHGSVTLNANGSFIYTPNPNFNGIDTFFYVAKAGDSESNIATVTITVNAVNDPPFFDQIADQFVNPPVNEPQTVPITGISPGPPDEAGQFESLILSATSNNPLISISSITFDGSVGALTYQRTNNSTGTATITVTADDQNGGTQTFTRTFDIVVGASGTVEANLTGFAPNTDPNKAPTVQVTVTARPIDWNGNGVIDVPGDCYRIFHPQTRRYNIVPSGADRSPEGPPWRLPTKNQIGRAHV